MKCVSRTQCLKNTQKTTAGGEAAGVYLKKNTIVRHWFQELHSQEAWMAFSKQTLIFVWSSTFSLMQMQVKLPWSISKNHHSYSPYPSSSLLLGTAWGSLPLPRVKSSFHLGDTGGSQGPCWEIPQLAKSDCFARTSLFRLRCQWERCVRKCRPDAYTCFQINVPNMLEFCAHYIIRTLGGMKFFKEEERYTQ